MEEIDMQKAKAELWKKYSQVGPNTAKAMKRMKNRTNKYTGIIEGKDMKQFIVKHKNKEYHVKAVDAASAVNKVRKFRDADYKIGDRVYHISQETRGTVEKLYGDGTIYVRWDEPIYDQYRTAIRASQIDPKVVNIKLIDKKIKDDRLSPSTYRKLKEFGYSSDDWQDWSQEQANKVVHERMEKGESKSSKTEESKDTIKKSGSESTPNKKNKRSISREGKKEQKPYNWIQEMVERQINSFTRNMDNGSERKLKQLLEELKENQGDYNTIDPHDKKRYIKEVEKALSDYRKHVEEINREMAERIDRSRAEDRITRSDAEEIDIIDIVEDDKNLARLLKKNDVKASRNSEQNVHNLQNLMIEKAGLGEDDFSADELYGGSLLMLFGEDSVFDPDDTRHRKLVRAMKEILGE